MNNSSTKPTRKQRAAIYREAARLLAERTRGGWCSNGVIEYGCEALQVASGELAGGVFASAMRRRISSGKQVWLSECTNCELEEELPIRVLALCFMAAMVEAGDA